MPKSLRDQPEYRLLADAIREAADGRPLVHVANPGNWGDALIAEGARSFFHAFGLSVREISLKSLRRRPRLRARLAGRGRAPLILYGGGGALAGRYPKHLDRVSAMLEAVGRAVILPSTFGADSVGLPLAPGSIAFRRDHFESREHLPAARFCHDMAFFLEPAPVRPCRRVGYFLREDVERVVDAPRPPDNRDISREGRHDTPIDSFFQAVGEAETLHTDRLHVAIAGALLEREVHFYPGIYFKNEAVYRSSLEPHFPNVRFHPTHDGLR